MKKPLLKCAALVAFVCTASRAWADVVDERVVSRQAEVDSLKRHIAELESEQKKATKETDEAWSTLEKAVNLDMKPDATILSKEPKTGPQEPVLQNVCGKPEGEEASDAWVASCKASLETAKKNQAELEKVRTDRDFKRLEELFKEVKEKQATVKARQSIAELKAFVICEARNLSEPTFDAAEWHKACSETIAAADAELKAAGAALDKLEEIDGKLMSAGDLLKRREAERDKAVALKLEVSGPRSGRTLADRLKGARDIRCYTAYCWGGDDGTEQAIEPILDLPIGISWALGNGALANYINANRVDVTVSAGLRYWFAYDTVSIGVLIARPSLSSNTSIRLEHSDVDFNSSAVSRPFPTLIVGFWGDVFAMTASYDQLRNTNGSGAADPGFLPNQVVSRTIVLGLSINTFTAVRNAVGAANPPKSEGAK